MGVFSKIIEVATGGLGGQIVDLVKTYIPADMPPEKKAELTLSIERLAMEREKNTNDAIRDSELAINERIREYEGTAKDLQAVPVLGPIMIFLRGAQRPIVGYAAVYLDYMVFSGQWDLDGLAQVESAFWVINVLVFGFLFGERAVRNVMPMVMDAMGKRQSK